MCGICGVLGVERSNDAETIVRRMMAAMRHRGPDEEGLLVSPPVALGIRRLSIIDLAGGHQPVFNEERSIAVVFNGEIYNFQELRAALEAQGHVFRTRSDTEAIVHAYETWGADCVQHLRGMFAFAVLDTRKQSEDTGARVFLARDRLGIKPLYYACVKGALLFASEVRALLASQWVAPRLSSSALEAYLLFGSVAEPTTLVEGVFSLPPGHRMSIALPMAPKFGEGFTQQLETCPKPYWDFSAAALHAPKTGARNSRAAAQELRPLLEDAVRSHLIADVPLGLFLSSGLDSTAIAALASRERKGLHTFTVVFPEEDFSEAEVARRTAKRFHTRHEELLLSGEELLARLEQAVAALDQPSMDGINTYFVSWAALQVGLKVALSGLGGDEVFGGYGTFRSTPRAARLAAWGERIPRRLRSASASAMASVGARGSRADATRKLAALWRDPGSFPHAYFFARALFTPEYSATLLGGATPGATSRGKTEAFSAGSTWWAWLEETARQAQRLDRFSAVSCLEMRSYMVNTLLRDTDAVSMSHSLEVRVPLLDHRLVEFVARLPESSKRRNRPKALLVEALGELLPSEVVRQHKRTFTFPWERWLRGALREPVAAGLANLTLALQPVLDRQAVQGVWSDFLAGRTSWSRPWSLYVLNEWCRRHLDGCGTSMETARPAVVLASGQGSA